jgi:hypothetical protein
VSHGAVDEFRYADLKNETRYRMRISLPINRKYLSERARIV